MCSYKNSSLCIESSKVLIALKIERQSILLKKYKKLSIKTNIHSRVDSTGILLEEARTAKGFWYEFGQLLPYMEFPSRKPRRKDIVNQLLDVGYHHLMNVIKGILDKYQIPTVMGLLHVARNSDSVPLVYDLMEMFRSDIVDTEVLRFLRLKKKKLKTAQNEVSHFLHEINQRLDKKYYLKEFQVCHTYRYYMEVQILKFIKSINRKEVFKPIALPNRHENRCS